MSGTQTRACSLLLVGITCSLDLKNGIKLGEISVDAKQFAWLLWNYSWFRKTSCTCDCVLTSSILYASLQWSHVKNQSLQRTMIFQIQFPYHMDNKSTLDLDDATKVACEDQFTIFFLRQRAIGWHSQRYSASLPRVPDWEEDNDANDDEEVLYDNCSRASEVSTKYLLPAFLIPASLQLLCFSIV